MCILFSFFWRFLCFFNICLQFKMLKLFPDSLASFCLFLLKSQFFIALQLSLYKYFYFQSQSYITEFPAHVETGGGRCPKLKGPNVPYMLKNIGIQPNPQKCQTANSNKCQITLFALGVCKIYPGRTFFSPIPSPTAAPIYFVHFRKVQVLNLGRKSNQSAIWSKIFRTPDEH